MSQRRSPTSLSTRPCSRPRRRALLAAGGFLATLILATPSHADQIGPYSGRSLTLGRGTLRIDGGPPDYGYFHPASPQWLNENRGFRMRVNPDADTMAWLGVGFAGGATDDIEVGGLLLPLRIGPDPDVDDLEAYGRFRFLDGPFEMAFQATLQLPAMTEWGLGLGLPMLAHTRGALRIDTGFEFEFLFWDQNTVLALDGPAAFTWDVGRHGFLGLRTGVYVADLLGDQDGPNDVGVTIPAGVHGGVVVGRGNVDLGAWFMWPQFLDPGREDGDGDPHPLEVEIFELGFGVNGRIPG